MNLMNYDHIIYSLNQGPLGIKKGTDQMGHQISRSKIGLSPANWEYDHPMHKGNEEEREKIVV